MRKIGILCLTLIMLMGFAVAPVAHAQDEMAKVTCDSTLVALLLVAEYEYGYVSEMMAMEDMAMPELEKGQFAPLFDSIMMMNAEMMEGEMMEEGDMAAHDEMLGMYMGMDSAGMMASYAEGMGMEMGDMVVLTPGNVEGEDATCATVRASVEQFLLAHFLTEMSMMSMDEG
jgi:hypothetical protein